MKEFVNNKKVRYFCTVAVLVALPLFSAAFMCLTQNTMIQELYIPNAINSDWNDEIFYYKQVEGIRDYGSPQGYFGYNESHAIYGTMGAWTPILYLFFVAYSKIFGWSFTAPIWCNLFMLMAAMGIFALRVRPDLKQMVLICGLYFAFMPITRFSMLCMPEVSIIFLIILFCAVWIPLEMKSRQMGESDASVSWKELFALYATVTLLVLMRPYYVLLLVPAGYQIYRKTESRILIGLSILYAIGILGLFFKINSYFCATYFWPTINFSWLTLLRKDFMAGLFQIAYILSSSFRSFLIQCGLGITDNSMVGGVFTVYFSVMCMLFYNFFVYRRRVYTDMSGWGWAISLLFMLCIKFLCYTVGTGYRHLLGWIILGSLILAVRFPAKNVCIIIAVMFWCFFVKGDAGCEELPVGAGEVENEITAGSVMLQGKVVIDPNSVPWDNTIIWLYIDDSFIKWQDLYALPSGIGINLCTKEYVLDNYENLCSKYIMTNIGGEVDTKCLQTNKELLAEYDEVHVWKLR